MVDAAWRTPPSSLVEPLRLAGLCPAAGQGPGLAWLHDSRAAPAPDRERRQSQHAAGPGDSGRVQVAAASRSTRTDHRFRLCMETSQGGGFHHGERRPLQGWSRRSRPQRSVAWPRGTSQYPVRLLPGPALPGLLRAAACWSVLRTGNPGLANIFERQAGLEAGGYISPPGQHRHAGEGIEAA